ncbi:MAG: hypothetical protein DIU68_007460 [Chloroflexota bacterium]|nr:MAG: hypothetical protein DIU68_16700 [Chloroflexota bacterium]
MSQQWFGHVLRRTHWRPQRQAVALATLSLIIGIIIGALYLAQSAAASTLGRQLEDMIALRNELEQENERLRAEIASLQSVPRLLARAQELGFTMASRDRIEYLTIEGYNPYRNQIVTRVETTRAETVPVYDESFSGWLQQQFDALSRQFEMFTSRGEQP